MPKQIDIVYEMVFFVKKMPESDKSAFKKFIEDKRNGKELVSMLRAFDRCSIDDPAKGLIKRLIVIKSGKDNRMFSKFKSWLFEFEITRKRTNYFKNQDHHGMLEIELKKTFLAAQMMTDKDAYLTSIEVMKETYRRARRFEFLQIQQDCANNLSSFYSFTGSIKMAKDWKKVSENLNTDISSYLEVYGHLEKRFQQISCCPQHNEECDTPSSSPINKSLTKIMWMENLLNKEEKNVQNPSKAFKSHLILYRILNNNPGIFPLEFKAVITKLILLDLYQLSRNYLLSKFATKIYLLDFLAVHQRVPLLHFFLYYLIKSRNYRILELLLDDLNKFTVYHHFKPFVSHFRKIEILYFFLRKKYKKVLRNINRESPDLTCVFQEFELRFIEILCLKKLKDDVSAFQKLENLRRFVFRNEDLKASLVHVNLYRSLRSHLNNQSILDMMDTKSTDVYDLSPLYFTLLSHGKPSETYAEGNNSLNLAAENTDNYLP